MSLSMEAKSGSLSPSNVDTASNPQPRWYESSALCRSVAVVAGAVMLLRVILGMGQFTNTVDEPFHMGAGVALWDVGKHILGTEHPPLPRLVAGLPLYLGGMRVPQEIHSKTVRSELQSYQYSSQILFNGTLDYRQALRRARLAMLVFPALALLYLYLLARWVSGSEMVAMLAVVFFSFDPNLLGNSFWVTTDAAACAGFLASSYHGLKWIYRRTWGRAAGAGVAIGLGVSCKLSCGLVVPALLGVLVGHSLAWREFRTRPVRRTIAQMALVAVVAFVALWGTYLFDVSSMSDQTAFHAQHQWQMIPQWMKDAPLPMPSLPLGVLRLLGHNRWGHPAYLNGDISRYGWWWYFPEAIALKSPLALLVALLCAIGALLWLRGRGFGRTASALAGGGLLLGVAMFQNLNIGIRHVLPVIPLLYLLACVTLVRARLTGVLIGLIVVACVETAWIHPDYIAFFNLAAGGPRRGERFLLDSNLDWGQDVGRLAEYLKSEPVSGSPYTLRLFAFPTPELVESLGLDPQALDRPPGGLLAISKNVRYGLTEIEMLPQGVITQTEDYSWLALFPLVKRVGYSIDVYDLSTRPIARPSP